MTSTHIFCERSESAKTVSRNRSSEVKLAGHSTQLLSLVQAHTSQLSISVQKDWSWKALKVKKSQELPHPCAKWKTFSGRGGFCITSWPRFRPTRKRSSTVALATQQCPASSFQRARLKVITVVRVCSNLQNPCRAVR